ncbi:sulfate ABC transporter substrate-binding protein [Egbenema bharatensis]|uniref:sulfate ABC transporter substrate-binding protein n=1 Tax=Egbenema bharatensis TaxID=3463334 RepID=UPI003A8B587A
MGVFKRSLQRSIALFLLGLGMCWSIAACSAPEAGDGPRSVELTLVSYAVTRSAYENIIPQFAAKWKAEHNQDVFFNYSYGASGSQSRAVVDGLPADIVSLALELDVQRIEETGLIEPGWQQEAPYNSVAQRSVVALVTRENMAQPVTSWADLTREDVQIVTANPKTSGGARWNFLALWGAITETGGTEEQALDFTKEVFRHAPALTRDARESSDAFFTQGQGNVLINYENEMILARRNGIDLEFIVPTDVNISIDCPAAVVDANVDRHGTREVAEAFLQYLFTPEAQREFASAGFRSVDPQVEQEFADQYPKVDRLFTIEDLGGWNAAQAKFFADQGIFDQIQAEIGRS